MSRKPPKKQQLLPNQPCTSRQARERDKQQQQQQPSRGPQQTSIKSMLLSKQQQRLLGEDNQKAQEKNENPEPSNSITLIPYIVRWQDIRTANFTNVSMLTRVWFREHSNVDLILDNYLLQEKVVNPNKVGYLNQVIRTVIASFNSRRKYPFNEFKFYSRWEEVIGRTLLMYPDIITNDDLADTLAFFQEHGLRWGAINMTHDNDAYKTARLYLEKKRLKHGSGQLSYYYGRATDAIIEKYYRERNLEEMHELETIDIDTMCAISNFKVSVKKSMEKDNFDPELLEMCMDAKLTHFKNNPEEIYKDARLLIKPKFVVVTNNITQEQEDYITVSIDNFYNCTNALDCLLRNKMFIPSSCENVMERSEERRSQFFLKYIRTKGGDDRRRPPFHNLRWRNNCLLRADENHSSHAAAVANEISSSSDANQTIASISKQLGLSRMGQESSMEQHELNIIKDLFMDKKFLGFAKRELQSKYPLNFDKQWRDLKKTATANFILDFLRSDREALDTLINQHCEVESREKLRKLLQKSPESGFTFATSTQNIIDEPAREPAYFQQPTTSTPQMPEINEGVLELSDDDGDDEMNQCEKANSKPNISPSFSKRARPLQLNENSLDEIIPAISSKEETSRKVAEAEIKKERAPSEGAADVSSSDCLIVTQEPDVPVMIIDSDDEQMQSSAQSPDVNDLARDKYQRNIDVNSEDLVLDENDDQMEVDPRETQRSELSEISQIVQNTAKRSSNEQSGGGGFQAKRPKKKLKSRLEYLSQGTDGEENGNSRCPNVDPMSSQMSNENFSIFFSTQVMLDHDRNLIEPPALTFIQSPKNCRSSAANEGNSLGKICFHFDLLQVIFLKLIKFEIVVNVPHHSITHAHIKEGYIKEVLQLNEQEWNTLLDNLHQLESYEYKSGENRRRKGTDIENQIAHHLDMYFAMLPKFKNFHLESIDGHFCQISSATTSARSTEVSGVLSEALKCQIKMYKNKKV